MKLLLCLCFLFCFKVVFSQIPCYLCGTSLQQNNIVSSYDEHNNFQQHHISESSNFIQQHPMFPYPRPPNFHSQVLGNNFRQQSSSYVDYRPSIDINEYPRRLIFNQQHNENIYPRTSVYEDEERFNRFVSKPYERPEDESDLYAEFLTYKLGQQSPYGNENLPSTDLYFHQNNLHHNYPRGPIYSQHQSERIFPRPSVYEDEQRSLPINPFASKPYERHEEESNLYAQFLRHKLRQQSSYDNENLPSSEHIFPRPSIYEDDVPHRANNQPGNLPSSNSKVETPKIEEKPMPKLPKQNDFNSVRIMRSLQSNEMPIADIRKHNNFKLLPLDEQCGKQENTDRIFSGEDAQLGEFPWMALLEYSFNGRNIGFKCGGALINNRYVLTAAHCVFGKSLRPQQKVFRVRLGEHDLSKVIDCDEEQYCSDPPLNLGIEEIVVHDAYNTTDTNIYNDIALIRLKESIIFTDFISPICLPLNGEQTNPGKYMTISGWGSINNDTGSNIKQKAKVIRRDEKECKEIWKDSMNVENQLCAGGISERNTCSGDSGTPIISTSPKSQWYIEGITSFGGSHCGGSPVPNVYTRVSSYLTWILDNIRA